MTEVYIAYVFIAVVAFIVGRRSVQNETLYRMGRMIHDTLVKMTKQRVFVGEENIKLIYRNEWIFDGRKMRLIIEHDPAEPINVTEGRR